jgi:hypothetical protein
MSWTGSSDRADAFVIRMAKTPYFLSSLAAPPNTLSMPTA